MSAASWSRSSTPPSTHRWLFPPAEATDDQRFVEDTASRGTLGTITDWTLVTMHRVLPTKT